MVSSVLTSRLGLCSPVYPKQRPQHQLLVCSSSYTTNNHNSNSNNNKKPLLQLQLQTAARQRTQNYITDNNQNQTTSNNLQIAWQMEDSMYANITTNRRFQMLQLASKMDGSSCKMLQIARGMVCKVERSSSQMLQIALKIGMARNSLNNFLAF